MTNHSKLFSWHPGQTFTGHVWVQRGEKIIDPYFPEYDFFALVNNCSKRRVYGPASAKVQTVWLEQLILHCPLKKELMFGECFSNAVLEINARGGHMVMGSLGFQPLMGSVDIHWEYGDVANETVVDFTRI